MAVYAMGDIQGCYKELMALLDKLRFDTARDRLWFTGDLVNRGPDSLAVLRFVRSLGQSAVTVLGNHDLHLLALAEGCAPFHRSGRLQDVLSAPDRDELLHWLRFRPLLHHDPQLQYTMVHAGLPPQWNLEAARRHAAEVEAVLRGGQYREFFAAMYGDQPRRWDESLAGLDRLRFITNCLTRLRYCEKDGGLCLDPNGEPGTQPAQCLPWFDVPGRASDGQRVVFGHWSTLGLYRGQGVRCVDSGCLWGGRLTALNLQTDEIFSVDCVAQQQPGAPE